jgi:hypothetical protein
MAYLSQNHCLETLEFTMDASRYRKHYTTMMDEPGAPLAPTSEGCEYVRMLWQKLLDAYIVPNGPREVNLPSNIRDDLLSQPNDHMPPTPDCLDKAVKIIYELMDESVLVPFLNSVSSTRGPQSCITPYTSSSDQLDAYLQRSNDDRKPSPVRDRSRRRRETSPPVSSLPLGDVVANSFRGRSPRVSHQSHLSAALSRTYSSRLSQHLSNASATSSTLDPAETTLTDDSSSSPSASALEPMTPPTTPPTSDLGFVNSTVTTSPSTSPRDTARDSGSGWKKVSQKLGWRKSRSTHGSSSSTSTTGTSGGRKDEEETNMS